VPTDSRAGQLAERSDLVDVARLVTAYYSEHPDPSVPDQRVSFGTSGHRGSSLRLASTTTTLAPPPRRSVTTGPRPVPTGRCSSPVTPTPCRSRRG